MARNFYRLAKHGWGHQEWYGFFDSDQAAIDAFLEVFKDDQRRDREGEKSAKAWDLARGRKYWHGPRKKPEWSIERFGYIKPGAPINGWDLPWKSIYIIQQGDD